jgi:hypothetical protein
MQKIIQMVCLIVLCTLVAIICMTQAATQADEDNSLLSHLIEKRQTGCSGCPSCGCPSVLGCMICGSYCCWGK